MVCVKAEKGRVMQYLVLGILTLFFCWLYVGRFGVFGSNVDWISQHSVIPDYFRQQFYDTKQFFPEFALGLGGGQNIYYFSYYGLYSPVILLSYFLPFVKMSDYIMAASVVCLVSAVLLFYHWLLKKGFSQKISVCTALLFLLAAPMIYHSYSQIMFVNYMPFLCLGFYGVDRYFEKRRCGLMVLSIFLMILTSFYFSIGGMLVLVLYGVHRYLEQKQETGCRVTVRGFLADGCRYLCPMLTAVLMSAVLLIPTALVLMGERSGGTKETLGRLLVPQIRVTELVYSPYGIGLTTLVITVLIAGLGYRKRREKFLSLGCIIILTVPLFSYLLNGGLYIRDKVMIPFLPLLCYMTASYLKRQEQEEQSVKKGILPYLLTFVVIIAGQMEYPGDASFGWKTFLLLAESVPLLGGYLLYRWRRQILLLILPSLFFLAGFGFVFHAVSSKAVNFDTYQKLTDSEIGKDIKEVLKEEEGFFRMEQEGNTAELAADLNRVWDSGQYISSLYSSAYNPDYQKFRTEIFGLEQPFRNAMMQSVSVNPVFRKLMGVRYVISEENVPGYRLFKKGKKTNIYVNDEALPLIYATDEVISEKEYESLSFPYNQTVFLHYAVTENGGSVSMNNEDMERSRKKELETETVPVEMSLPELKAGTTVKLPLPESEIPEGERVLYVRFKVKNQDTSKDVAVWLDGIRNKLSAKEHIYYNGNTTFTYVETLEDGQKEAELILGKGNYEIQDLECYIGRASVGSETEYSALRLNRKSTKGNRIAGTVDVKSDGYLITSIPYDQNFEVRIDGVKAENEKVNQAFLGTRVKAGTHRVEIIYHTPGVKAGKVLSVLGLILCIGLMISEKMKCNTEELNKRQKSNLAGKKQLC